MRWCHTKTVRSDTVNHPQSHYECRSCNAVAPRWYEASGQVKVLGHLEVSTAMEPRRCGVGTTAGR